MLTAAQIRECYVRFFVERGHTHVPSAPLVPPDDPTLMFTSAGMVQFKALYSGAVPLPYTRAVTVQKCLRAGGKGSDLENVGKTLRHHTFFEMLGNFSFGDYFKREAIRWAWEFCTDPQWLGLPPDRIWATVFGKPDGRGGWIVDDEAERCWRDETGVVNPIVRLDEKENFWGPAGETGACGPCSEIKFFMGDEAQREAYQRLAASDRPEDREQLARAIVEQGDLFLEIWNLVFPQYDQQLDGSRPPLKNRGIDTGAGLERVTTAVQFWQSDGRVRSPYETDLLAPLVRAVAELAGLPYPALSGGEAAEAAIRARGLDPAHVRLAMNACADHARALTFCLSEGIVPSNEGRGYVLRRILRRAARFGRKLGLTEPFLWRLVGPVVEIMGGVYPEITAHPHVVERTIRTEEERFNRTLNQGGQRLDELLAALAPGQTLSGEEAYRLYDTYGFPLDLTIETAEEHGVAVDVEGFERALAAGKARARASWKGGAGTGVWADLLKDLGDAAKTEFTGYEKLADEARVLAIVVDGQRVERLSEGHAGVLVVDRTPFYAEAGGQVGDRGLVRSPDGVVVFDVEDTRKTDLGCHLHFGEAQQEIAVGQTVRLEVDAPRRRRIMGNHSVTHLMQAALKRIVGAHVTQQGSFVGPDGLRFDFTHPEPLGEETLRAIERLVNEKIREDLPVITRVMALEEARATGAIAPFGEKYGARVRVVSMGEGDAPFSREFCGGTHVRRTGQIGFFLILGESSVASGIRRLEAVTGEGAWERVARERKLLNELSRRLSAPPEALIERIDALQEELRTLRRQADQARLEQARAQVREAAGQVREVAGVRVVCGRIDAADHDALAQAWDAARGRLRERAAGLFYAVADGKVLLVAGVTDDLAPARLSAGDVLREAAALVGGKGGGRPTLARGGGPLVDAADRLEAALPDIVARCLKA